VSRHAPDGNSRTRFLFWLPHAPLRGWAHWRVPSMKTVMLTGIWLALATPIVMLAMVSWFFATALAVLWRGLFGMGSRPNGS